MLEAAGVLIWFDRGKHLPIFKQNCRLEKALRFLVKVPVLKVVDDCDVIDFVFKLKTML